MPKPFTPKDCDLRDFPRMMIDIQRLFSSEFDAVANDTEWRFGLTLWLKSFHQVPAASLPDDDVQLARLCGLGRDVRSWLKAKTVALRGWVRCEDGLIYHPVVAEVALEAWIDKLLQRLSSGAGNSARWKVEFDPKPIEGEIASAANLLFSLNPKARVLSKQKVSEILKRSHRESNPVIPPGPEKNPTGIAREGKGREEERKIEGSNDPSVGGADEEVFGDELQPPPKKVDAVRQAFDAWNALAEELGMPKATALNDGRRAKLKVRLRDNGMDGWMLALQTVRETPFLHGATPKNFTAHLDFLLQPSSFQKVIEGAYRTTDRGRAGADGRLDDRAERIGNMRDGALEALNRRRS